MFNFTFIVFILALHSATSQECTAAISLASLQCGGTSPSVGSGPQQGLPGKRGPTGLKGEKGEAFGDEETVTSIINKLEALEDKLKVQKDKVEVLEEYKKTAESQIANLTELVAGITKMRSCQDIYTTLKIIRNGIYKIQPSDDVDPFQVNCQFIGNKVITTIGHDAEGEIEVASKCGGKRCYSKSINYQASILQMRSLVERVGDCRQFIKYRCIGSGFLRDDWGGYVAGWFNWNREMKSYWGGSGGREGYCACGVRGDCADPEWHCNCDKNDIVDREDSGYLTQADDLPVHTLFFGDVDGENEAGYHTLGPLECMG